MTNDTPSPIWGHLKHGDDARAAQAAGILAGSDSSLAARHLAQASARHALLLRERLAAADVVEKLDLRGWVESYWEDAIDYLEFAGVLTRDQAALAHKLTWAEGAAWPGTLEELVVAVRGVTAE